MKLKFFFWYVLSYLILAFLLSITYGIPVSFWVKIFNKIDNVLGFCFLLLISPCLVAFAFSQVYKCDIFNLASNHKDTIYINKNDYTEEELEKINSIRWSKIRGSESSYYKHF